MRDQTCISCIGRWALEHCTTSYVHRVCRVWYNQAPTGDLGPYPPQKNGDNCLAKFIPKVVFTALLLWPVHRVYIASYCNCQRFRFFPVWWVQQSLLFDYLAHCSKTQILIDALWYFILRRDHNLLSFPFLLGTQCVPNFLLCKQRFIEHPCT